MRRYVLCLFIVLSVLIVVIAILLRDLGTHSIATIPLDDRVIEVDLCLDQQHVAACTLNSFRTQMNVNVFRVVPGGDAAELGHFYGESTCWINECEVLATVYWSELKSQLVFCSVRPDGNEIIRYSGTYPGPPPVHMQLLFDSGEVLGVAGAMSDWEHPPLSPVVMSPTHSPVVLLQNDHDVFSAACLREKDRTIVAFSFRDAGTLEVGVVRKENGMSTYSRSVTTDIHEPCGLAFADRGKNLVALCKSRLVVIDVATGITLREVPTSQIPRPEQLRYSVSASENGSIFAYLDGAGVHLDDASLMNKVDVSFGDAMCLDLSVDGSTLAVGFSSPSRVEVFDIDVPVGQASSDRP